MNDKEKDEDLVKEESEDITKEVSKKKEQSNGKKMFKLLSIVVIAMMAIIIGTGSWNPFKSREVAPEATKMYEKGAYDVMEDVFRKVNKKADIDTENPDFAPNGSAPYGFLINDFGPQGERGILLTAINGRMETHEQYAVQFGFDVMKNEDYAIEHYKGIRNESPHYKEYEYNGGKNVAFFPLGNFEAVDIILRDGVTVYEGHAYLKDYDKIQSWFDMMGFDFKVPSKKELSDWPRH